MCGEKFLTRASRRGKKGSPPRMRGKVSTDGLYPTFARITPAYAGKSSRNETCWHRPWNHPCVCGEKIEMPYELLLKEGSPPRMRGKDKFHTTIQRTVRITPACAGKSAYRRACDSLGWDHPRACGEKCAGALKNSLSTGSPPRMRGKERAYYLRK